MHEEAEESQDVLKLREALEEIAAQKTSEEMSQRVRREADFEDAYDHCINVARETLGIKSKNT